MPRRFVGDNGADEVGTTDREVDRDRRGHADTDHDRRWNLQAVQEGGSICRVRRDRVDRLAARARTRGGRM